MRRYYLTFALLGVGFITQPSVGQRLDQPGSVAEGGTSVPLSTQAVAARCRNEKYRAKAQVECARNDAWEAAQAKRRSHHR